MLLFRILPMFACDVYISALVMWRGARNFTEYLYEQISCVK